MPSNSIIVIDMVGNIIELRVSGTALIDEMKLIGFSVNDKNMTLNVSNNQDKQRVIQLLISAEAYFLYGNGWYPSELMEYYKDQGVDIGKYKVIFWTDKDTYHIKER
ncbi:hypothetical protein ACIPMZ_03670 [Scandinavium goeteborgense]|uniref:hypothetical protein n=1 Tax=Scandinavium goeteborgense TaxID=1851514 RepID=UPI003828F3B0